MRRTLCYVLLSFTVQSALSQTTMVMPPFLTAGDTIAVVSPSSCPDSASLEAGIRELERWGYRVLRGPHVLNNVHSFAGTADERASDLLWALRRPGVKAVMCSRGGDGAVQVLQRIPLRELARHPKWVIGFSDVTALHSALVQAGMMSIHSTMCTGIANKSNSDKAIMQRLLHGILPTYIVPGSVYDQQGEATGMLVGGNLSVFCGLAGSDYDFLNHVDDGIILFIEDTKEAFSKIDRMIHHLEIRGVLPKLKGLIVGHFHNCGSDKEKEVMKFKTVYEMLHYYLKDYNIPICYDFPVGHQSNHNYPMIEGCQVKLKVTPIGTTLQFLSAGKGTGR